jgi:phage gp29-like protein
MATTLYDHRGNPIQLKQLERELAGSTASVRGNEFDSMANRLTPSKLAGILNEIQEDPTNYLTLAMEMEEREPHYASVLSTRKLAVSGIAPVVEAAGDDKAAQDLADAVWALVDRPNFTDLVEDLLDALGKGFSVCEIMWQRGDSRWTPEEYRWRDPRWFKFDYKEGEQLRLRDQEIQEGVPLAPYKFICHYPQLRTGLKIRGGLARLACVSYMCKNYDIKDWMRFVELFAQPLRMGRYDATASDKDREILKRAVTMLGVDAAAILPKGMEIEFQEIGNVSAGATVYEKLASWLDRQMSKAVLGQTMTADDGSSQAQANVHNDVRGDILRADARRLAATLNNQLVKPFIDLNFGVQEAYPRIVIPVEEPDDLTAWTANVAAMVDKGLKVTQKHVREKLNLPDPEADEELLMPPASTAPDPAGALNSRLRIGDCRLKKATALNSAESDDLEEILAGALEGWQVIEDESFTPLRDAITACNSYEEMKAVLDEYRIDADTLVQTLATAMFKSRASGEVAS